MCADLLQVRARTSFDNVPHESQATLSRPDFGVLVLLLSTLLSTARADDWPQWRGPNRDGVWRESDLIQEFPEKELRREWTVPIGSGYSGPTVAEGRVFVTDRLVDPKQIERVHCFDEATGDTLWTFSYECPYEGVGYEAGPRAAVTIDNQRAFALGTMGNLHVLDVCTGEVFWKRDINADYQVRMPIWGIAAAPLIYEETVILHIGGADGASVIALDKTTGQEHWRALEDSVSYSAPILIQQAGQTVLVCWTGDHVTGLNPADGSVHWKIEMKPTRMVINIATPVHLGNRLFMTCFYDGALMIELGKDELTAKTLWRKIGLDEKNTEALHSIMSTPVMIGEQIYGVDSYGELRCLDAATGQRIWEDQTATPRARWGNIHMVRNNERVWMFNERGQLLIGQLSREKFTEISRAQLISPTTDQLRQRGGVCWAHPAYANRKIFARNDRELVCASLASTPPTEVAKRKMRWWKGNIHTHTLWSDGNDFPEMIADWYASRDYNFLALSDHNLLSEGIRWMKRDEIIARGGDEVMPKYLRRFGPDWVESRVDLESGKTEIRLKPLDEFRHQVEQRNRFIMIPAEEISDAVGGKPVHMNATNLRDAVPPVGGVTVREAIRNNLRAVQEQADRTGREILLHVNHPNFRYGISAEDIAAVVSERFFEVYNGHPATNHLGDEEHPSVERLWDIANTIRIGKLQAAPLFGVSTDDSHTYDGREGSRPGRGWIVVRSRFLTPEYLIRAIKKGSFYASSGVTLNDVVFDQVNRTLRVSISAVGNEDYTIRFIGSIRPDENSANVDPDGIGVEFLSVAGRKAEYQLTGKELFVRAVVTSSQDHPDPSFDGQKKQAWTQPVGWILAASYSTVEKDISK